MKQFITYEKMSKKQQKLINAAKRGSWGNVKPITKVKGSAKVYNRKKQQGSKDYGYSFGSLAVYAMQLLQKEMQGEAERVNLTSDDIFMEGGIGKSSSGYGDLCCCASCIKPYG